MPMKVRLIKILEEIRDPRRPPVRRPPLKSAMLYLMELRSHAAGACQPKKRLLIALDPQDHLNIPHQVKITHLAPGARPAAQVPA